MVDRCPITLHLISADADTFGVTDLGTWLDKVKATLLADGSRGAVFGAAVVDGAFRADSAIQSWRTVLDWGSKDACHEKV